MWGLDELLRCHECHCVWGAVIPIIIEGGLDLAGMNCSMEVSVNRSSSGGPIHLELFSFQNCNEIRHFFS